VNVLASDVLSVDVIVDIVTNYIVHFRAFASLPPKTFVLHNFATFPETCGLKCLV
jgi:hypothetical protein